MKPPPLVEKDTLCPLEYQTTTGAQRAQRIRVGDVHDGTEFRVHVDHVVDRRKTVATLRDQRSVECGQRRQLTTQGIRSPAVSHRRRIRNFERVRRGLTDPLATRAVSVTAASILTGPVGGHVNRRRQPCARIDPYQIERISNSERFQSTRLPGERDGLEQHESREKRRDAGERSRTELRKRVVALADRHVVRCLCPTVEADHCGHTQIGLVGAKPIDGCSLPRISEPEVYDDDIAVFERLHHALLLCEIDIVRIGSEIVGQPGHRRGAAPWDHSESLADGLGFSS